MCIRDSPLSVVLSPVRQRFLDVISSEDFLHRVLHIQAVGVAVSYTHLRLACKRAHDGFGSLLPFSVKSAVGYFWVHFPKSMQSELVSFRRRILLRHESSYLAMRQVAALRKTAKGESRKETTGRRSC